MDSIVARLFQEYREPFWQMSINEKFHTKAGSIRLIWLSRVA
jgi:hypothetical protein